MSDTTLVYFYFKIQIIERLNNIVKQFAIRMLRIISNIIAIVIFNLADSYTRLKLHLYIHQDKMFALFCYKRNQIHVFINRLQL